MRPYRHIAHIDVVRPYAPLDDFEMMSGIVRLICEAGLQDHLGVALLHEHFRLGGGEFWLERAEGDLVVSRPAALYRASGAMHPMIWRLMSEKGAQPIHWRAGADPEAARIAAFLTDTAPCLSAMLRGDVDRFGIIRAPMYPEFSRGLSMRETATAAGRALVCEWSDDPGEGVVQTAWYFQAPAQVCVPVTRTFCRSFCLKTKDGHTGAHASEPMPGYHESD